MKMNTLRSRVVTWYVGLLAAALVLFGAALYLGVRDYLRTALEQTLHGEGGTISSTFLANAENKGTAWMTGEINEAYDPELTGRFIRISRQDGALLYRSSPSRDPLIEPSAIPAASRVATAAPFRTEKQLHSDTLLIHTQVFTSQSGTRYWVETGASLAPMNRVLSGVLRMVLGLIPLILIAAAIGGLVFMRVPLQPLLSLAEQAEYIGLSALGERLPVIATGDEMERLSLSLNRMITRLEEALSNNRRFSADVSHELRTPLTIMRGELEHVLLESSLTTAARLAVCSVLDEISRLTKIVEGLLTIARLDAGADAIHPQPADLASICLWTVEQMHLLAEEKAITIQLDTLTLPVYGDTARLKQVFVNLLDNAIKYTPHGGLVAVTFSRTEQLAAIEIADTGIGIGAAELPHIFDRFYRADSGRARASGGTGLGLSIVKAICNAHGGDITIKSEGAGTVVRVELPLLKSQNLLFTAPPRQNHNTLQLQP